ncbi:MAG: hypothetical protein OXH09_09320 [Gammaproteobacteria bacterium]|nr:hypothetical protein [Gammaproteobacteria bacterium]
MPGSPVSVDVDSRFGSATALVSVYREGVLDAFVTDLEESNPVTTVPVAPNYAPNVSVSVLARNQPQAPEPAPSPQIVQTGANAQLVLRPDGPTWRRGAADMPVDWAANTLDVRVTVDRETYGPREPVKVRLAVLGPDGAPARND